MPIERTNRIISSRIVNGLVAAANQFPYQVSLLLPGPQGTNLCGGSIITDSWVLSAAHCTRPVNQFNIRFGSLSLNSGGITQTSFRAINHAQFNSQNLNNDISLVNIPTPLTWGSAAIQPIRLPTAGQVSTTFVNIQARASGFGVTEQGGISTVLRFVDQRVIGNAQCASTYGTSVIVPHVICTLGFSAGNQGTCSGDSGGPLAVWEGDAWTQVGVVAFVSAAGCGLGHPNGFMRTSHFTTWVNQQTGLPVRS